MKKIFCLILAAMLAASCVACSDNSADTTEESAETAPAETTEAVTAETVEAVEETAEEDELPAPEVKDMDGFEVTILNYTQTSFSWANTTMFTDELNGEVLNDALYKREAEVEENYNCLVSELADGSVLNTFKNSVTAGDTGFDTAMMFDANITDVLSGGYIMSWNSTPIDFSQPWWDSAATEQYSFSGIQASVSGAYSLYNYSTRHCYVFNTTMFADTNPGVNIYDLVREGTWTVDELYSLAANVVSDVNGDGTMTSSDDRYGITGTVTRHYSALLAGAGVKYIDRDENGSLIYAIEGNEYAMNVISKLVQINTGNDIYTSGTNDIGGGDTTPLFYNQKALFAAVYVGEAAKMRDADFEVGIVPPPKYDESQSGYLSLVEGGAQSILPKTLAADRVENVSVILNAFAYYSYKESVPAYIDYVLMRKVANNADSAEMLQIVFDNSFYDLGTGVWSSETKNQFTANVFLPKSDTAASLVAKSSKVLTRLLAKFESNIKELGE